MADDASVPTPRSGGIFISHVHEDQQIAEAFALLIQDITAGSVSTYSSSSSGTDGIKYGAEWFQWIKSSIDNSDHVVAILTPNSLERPWILFEAGLGKAHAEGTVFGLAVGVSVADASVGPFGVFQNSASTRPALMKLCREVIEPSGLRPREEVIGRLVDDFIEQIDAIALTPKESPEDTRSAAIFQALEDLKFMIRGRDADEPRPSSKVRDRDAFLLMQVYERAMSMRPLPVRLRISLLAEISAGVELSALAASLRVLGTVLEGRSPVSLSEPLYGPIFDLVMTMRPRGHASAEVLHLVRRELDVVLRELHERSVSHSRRSGSTAPRSRDDGVDISLDDGEDE